jgi:asparagine synthase (glutamine-hydrolysing)
MRHRGPDDQGFHLEDGVGLAFRRLSILDLQGGHQPMGNEDGSVQVVFNGEIYNYRELASQLAARGHVFRTRSDTEVLVHLYEEKGPDLVHDLRGMFAFALWDRRRRSLLLVRDRLGIKPLYYRMDQDEIFFASEIKGILAGLPPGIREIDPASLRAYLVFGYLPGSRSLFKGIQKLPPGHLLECREDGIVLRRYWSLPPVDPSPPFSRREAIARLGSLLEESVRLRLISDVPLGAFLSGGIDSSCVVALMRRLSPDPVKTFSIGFKEEDFDELPVARQVAAALGTNHHELLVGPDAVAMADQVVASFDEPFADASAIPTYLVSRLARTQVTVALSGDGGDELFAGYPRYRGLGRLRRLRRIPAPVRRALGWGTRRFSHNAALRLAGALERSLRPYPLDYLDSMNHLCGPGVVAALDPEVLPTEGSGWDMEIQGFAGDPVEGAQRLDLLHYLPEDILAKVDRMSMACSLEARVPLLDHHVVEFVCSLPPAWKQQGDRPKDLLLEAAGAKLPDSVWNRPKRGFGIPLAHWLRVELKDLLSDTLLDRQAGQRGIWNPAGMEALIRLHASGSWDLSPQLWQFLMLELWHRKYLDGASQAATPRPRGLDRGAGASLAAKG